VPLVTAILFCSEVGGSGATAVHSIKKTHLSPKKDSQVPENPLSPGLAILKAELKDPLIVELSMISYWLAVWGIFKKN
jgi:hypothetical protein